jgi:hypothetical protein
VPVPVVPPPPKKVVPPPPPEPSPLEKASVESASLIQTSVVPYGQVADRLEGILFGQSDPAAVLDLIDACERRLDRARTLYASVRGSAPDPALFERRIAILDSVLASLALARDRVHVQAAWRRAARLVREAVPLYEEVTAGMTAQSAPPDLDEKGRRVLSKLREARSLYEGTRGRAADEETLDRRVQSLERLAAPLEARFR